MILPPDNRKNVIMTFRSSNERGRRRTDYHAGRILIPHRIPALPFAPRKLIKVKWLIPSNTQVRGIA